MARRKRKSLNKEMRSQVKGILLLALAAFCYVGLIHTDQAGGIGVYVNAALRMLAGDASVLIPFIIALMALWQILPRRRWNIRPRLFGLLSLQLLFMIWIHLQRLIVSLPPADELFYQSFVIGLNQQGGGAIGAAFAAALLYLIGPIGSRILIVALAFIAVLLVFNISINRFLKYISRVLRWLKNIILQGAFYGYKNISKVVSVLDNRVKKAAQNRNNVTEPPVTASSTAVNGAIDAGSDVIKDTNSEYEQVTYHGAVGNRENKDIQSTFSGPEEKSRAEFPPVGVPGSSQSSPEYNLPPLELLSKPRSTGESHHLKSSKDRAKLLESTLHSFGVRAKVIHVQSGPTVTRFEVQPEAGVKVSKIINLSDDLALNLAAPLVRIEAPIPGKAALGIEVPNKVIALVNLREVMEDDAYRNSASFLTVALGKDITGIPVISDLTKMPHLLIAGATGAGKSVCLNTIITSILYKASPEEVRFMMIDPKVVELSVYNGIPHLMMPVLTDPRKAALALRNMVREMGRRYDLFAQLEVRDIGAYNELSEEDPEIEKLPFIVVLIDELADLMLVSPGEVEDSIARLAQMSRASGIHLIVATQRPSVDVLTGIIKANITSRVAFTVSSQFDSRTILDMSGAEKLLGRGDMLFYPVGSVKPYRVQGAYVSEAEVKKITDFIKEQGPVEYENGNTFLQAADETEEEEADALFAEAVDLVVRTGNASISLLQRRFRIGYTRAARLIDDLERKGIVGPYEGSKPREVLVTSEQAAKICEGFIGPSD